MPRKSGSVLAIVTALALLGPWGPRVRAGQVTVTYNVTGNGSGWGTYTHEALFNGPLTATLAITYDDATVGTAVQALGADYVKFPMSITATISFANNYNFVYYFNSLLSSYTGTGNTYRVSASSMGGTQNGDLDMSFSGASEAITSATSASSIVANMQAWAGGFSGDWASSATFGTFQGTFDAPVPEPSSAAMLATGAVGLWVALRRRGRGARRRGDQRDG